MPCISPCCERLQTTAATLKARGGALHPRRPSPTTSGIFIRDWMSRTGVPTFNQDGGHFGPAFRSASRRGPAPTPESGAVVLGAPRFRHRSRLPVRPSLRRKGELFFLGSPSRPMSRPVEIHDRRLGGQARDPPTPWALLSWLTCAALRSAG